MGELQIGMYMGLPVYAVDYRFDIPKTKSAFYVLPTVSMGKKNLIYNGVPIGELHEQTLYSFDEEDFCKIKYGLSEEEEEEIEEEEIETEEVPAEEEPQTKVPDLVGATAADTFLKTWRENIDNKIAELLAKG